MYRLPQQDENSDEISDSQSEGEDDDLETLVRAEVQEALLQFSRNLIQNGDFLLHKTTPQDWKAVPAECIPHWTPGSHLESRDQWTNTPEVAEGIDEEFFPPKPDSHPMGCSSSS